MAFLHLPQFFRSKERTVGLLVAAFFFLSGCGAAAPSTPNGDFQTFTRKVFCREVSSNTLNLHYTLQNPEKYGIEKMPITFGEFLTDPKRILSFCKKMERRLQTFPYEKLSKRNRLTYDVLAYSVGQARKGAPYILYEEPLSPTGGIQAQLPLLLSEYHFANEEDVKTYLALLRTTKRYFRSLIAFEKEKAAAGLFMDQERVDRILAQCRAFQRTDGSQYLFSTFQERVEAVPHLSQEKKEWYSRQNRQTVRTQVLPAYTLLAHGIQSIAESVAQEEGRQKEPEKQDTEKDGLCRLPLGRAYYAYLLQSRVGTRQTVEEMKKMVQTQIQEDLSVLRGIFRKQGSRYRAAAALPVPEPEGMLKELRQRTGEQFPEPASMPFRIKYVPKMLEKHTSPAFYMIPAVDYIGENVIYVNPAHMKNPLALYTTLAHEGYPGHMYQTSYYAQTHPDPVRLVFHFGGYIEGWATYAEMSSYYFSALPKFQAKILQKNSSVVLGMYTLADMGIHYEGWDLAKTADFLGRFGMQDEKLAKRIYDIIVSSPANYPKYYLGYVHFLRLKRKCLEREKGAFSQKRFHQAVLSVGPAPFELVEKYMWEER